MTKWCNDSRNQNKKKYVYFYTNEMTAIYRAKEIIIMTKNDKTAIFTVSFFQISIKTGFFKKLTSYVH
jgi:predicted SPOUT superfamily RNA methylase MTH1